VDGRVVAILKHYPEMFLEGLRKILKTLVRIAAVRDKI
jgi:hypothetical protein